MSEEDVRAALRKRRKIKTADTPAGPTEKIVPADPEREAAMEDEIRPLGHNRNVFYYYSTSAQQVIELAASAHGKLNFLGMAPLRYWASGFPNGNGSINWDLAADTLMARCKAVGVYDPGRVRGRGAWLDGGKTVLHLGDLLRVDGEEIPLPLFRSRAIYEAAPSIRPTKASPLPSAKSIAVLDLAKRFNWASSVSPYLLAGWCVVAPVCGALRWRPHLWVTGGSGTGKTTVLLRYMKPLLGEMGIYVQGRSSEAGIRNTLGSDARPVLFDEAESNDAQASERIQAILELMRSASSETGAKLVKGAANGSTIAYDIRSSFALVAINPAVKHAADETRVSFVTLRPRPSATPAERDASRAAWEELTKELTLLTPQFCAALFERTIRLIPTIQANAEVFAHAAALHLGNQRIGDQLGTLLAGAYSLVTSERVTIDRARDFLGTQDWSDHGTADRDEDQCLRHLLQRVVRVELPTGGANIERSLGELVAMASLRMVDERVPAKTAGDTLRRQGLRVDERTLYVSNSHVALERIFAQTPWTKWAAALARLPFCTGKGERVTFLPVSGPVSHGKAEQSRAVKLDVDGALGLI